MSFYGEMNKVYPLISSTMHLFYSIHVPKVQLYDVIQEQHL